MTEIYLHIVARMADYIRTHLRRLERARRARDVSEQCQALRSADADALKPFFLYLIMASGSQRLEPSTHTRARARALARRECQSIPY